MAGIASTHRSAATLVLATILAATVAHAGEKPTEYSLELSDPVAPTLPPRAYRVVQSCDEQGFPAGYALTFTTHVCVDEQCREVTVTMHWAALGYYQRLEYPADAPLTKKKHVPFSPEDYSRLDQILRDRDSILGSQPLEVFGPIVSPGLPQVAAGVAGGGEVTGGDVVDGWSGATPQAVKDAVVEDAAYTSWTMWRWANGEIVRNLQDLTEQRCTPEYLHKLLQSDDRRAVDFSLRYILRHCPTDGQFVADVFHVLETGDREHVALALQLLHRAVADKRRLYQGLIESYGRMNSTYSPLILDYLSAQPDLPAETLEGLSGVLHQLPYFQMHLALRLLDARAFFSPRVEADVAGLLDSPDFFIARRASEYLLKQPLGTDTKRKLDTFRQKYRDRL